MSHNVCMVSDFFYPNVGGVETHIYQLSQCLIERGHKVRSQNRIRNGYFISCSLPRLRSKIVIVTHAYGDRIGIRYLSNFLKVYYLPVTTFYNQNTLPTVVTTLPLFRDILVRERITIFHSHSAFSVLGQEGILHARTLGIRALFTDHSLFGFADGSSIITNKFLELSLADVHHVICVSHTSKENTVLRAALSPGNVSVIPNAIDTTQFIPDPLARNPKRVTIIVMSRLVYRKGMDLLARIIPAICSSYTNVDFIIGGDGPKRVELEEMREQEQLFNRVQFLGAVSHDDVRNVLVKGDIFLNTSLTEAFCIAIVEAASCGTRVGGVPEVLPSDMILMAEPRVQALTDALHDAIRMIKEGRHLQPNESHERVEKMYQWKDVAARTEKVYDLVAGQPAYTLQERLQRYRNGRPIAGVFYGLVVIVEVFFLWLLELLRPEKDIDVVPSPKPQTKSKKYFHHCI
ncbi:phosphatidylinositol N-acetylglucosaminyltransferase subunit A-like isoform X2 [Oscarella lobularis]|uniref:phosphatidylinositol N-acetylglucosaminyltransferase subunit A-like isoform X2 n=1 Tax=Oscarella lobularis TaxID=121494 RepID=UPI003313C137